MGAELRVLRAMEHSRDQNLLTATEVANYAVCPEAWRLKRTTRVGYKKASVREEEGWQLRSKWIESHDLSFTLRRYAKIAYLLTLGLGILVFLWDRQRSVTVDLPSGQAVLPNIPFGEIVMLLLLLGALIFIWDLFDRHGARAQKATGLDDKSQTIAVKGSSHVPAASYTSATLGLSGVPDAVIREGGFVIPVIKKPLSKKIRDRHVLELMVHLALIEENEDKRPPYGFIVIGQENRRVKINNSEDKQRWMVSLVDEMHSILEGIPAVPAPAPYKCKSCDVRTACSFSAYKPGKPTDIAAVIKQNGANTNGADSDEEETPD